MEGFIAGDTKLTDKVVSLYDFIKELNKLKQKPVLDYKNHPWACMVSDFPDDDENIKVFYRDTVDAEGTLSVENRALLLVHKPEYEQCPVPDAVFSDWLEPGWESFTNQVQRIESKQVDKESTDQVDTSQNEVPAPIVEHFADDPTRVEAFERWLSLRTEWVERQQLITETRKLFSDLYRIYFELQKDAETLELIVANGVICDRDDPQICHPTITKRVQLCYDPTADTIIVNDVDAPSELYSTVFQAMVDVNLSTVGQLQEDLQNNDYHPMDREDSAAFLKVIVHQLSVDSCFSENGIPVNWKAQNRILLYMAPCFIMRKRLDGTVKAIEQIVENVQDTGYIPAPIGDIVGGGKIELPEEDGAQSLEEQLAAVGGESVDVLLSKEANKEQLEIAKRIERYNAVLVQGPPGTGKTHTIANLMGHFLAQGKSVLVTSQTPKALKVLKEKIAPGLQNLCVSVLEDSNIDMERSIDGITDYMARTTSLEIKREMDRVAEERRAVIVDLASVRKKIYNVIHQECSSIVYNGEAISPSAAAKFIADHAADLSYIPGKVSPDAPLPLSLPELAELYQSNGQLSSTDEVELNCGIPDPASLIAPEEFARILNSMDRAERNLEQLQQTTAWKIAQDGEQLQFDDGQRRFSVGCPQRDKIERIMGLVKALEAVEPWMKYALVDGKAGGAYRKPWETLVEQIGSTCAYAERIVEVCFGMNIEFAAGCNVLNLVPALEKLKGMFGPNGKVSKISLLLNKDCSQALEAVTVNGIAMRSAKECEAVLHCIELHRLRSLCSQYWDELLSKRGAPAFMNLDAAAPERIAQKWIPMILNSLNWYRDVFEPLSEQLDEVGIPSAMLFPEEPADSELVAAEKLLHAVSVEVTAIGEMCVEAINLCKYQDSLRENLAVLCNGQRSESQFCRRIVNAIQEKDDESYEAVYSELSSLYHKYALINRRRELLGALAATAPQWASAIQNRVGIHGNAEMPDSICDAWKWKQLCLIIEEIDALSFSELQAQSLQLSQVYRRITADYAEKCAWYHLLRRTEGDIDMRHALQGWKQTVRKIGKGTGRTAPMLKAEARKLLAKCQEAVPSWIMPISRALDSFDPKINRFDIVIIDEASQSDVSSLAILYMGRKLVIVGDDKQVSPMAVGVEIDKITALQQMYIQEKIPNAHLYDAKTSIYDIAKTTFQPLMLREHFRCMPEIIGFSNMLSYDYKIKPLRDASSSTILPSVVSYRVTDGERLGNKTNPMEAAAIVALIQACIEQPEYAGKTFGVISLLGDEQVRVIQRMLEEKISPKDMVERNILCGNSSNFQGDERDVILLSMVDSGDGKGPLFLREYGVDDANRKRYNVAASRARDQLWVVNSLDPAIDLKPGDIRKRMIDYALNPHALDNKHIEIEEKADSPFEVGVATALVDRGYHLVQQWAVGGYRLDMVAVCGKRTVAIECDGERFHSGETKIREDMERQTILERLGWRFIRIRGSEYFRDPEKTMERVIHELSEYGIEPEGQADKTESNSDSELLNRVKVRAAQILSNGSKPDSTADIRTIEIALDPKHVTAEMDAVSRQIQVQPAQKTNPPLPENVQSIITRGQTGNNVESEPQREPPKEKKHTPRRTGGKRENQPIAPVKLNVPEQLTMAGMDQPHSPTDILDLIKDAGISYVDKRKNGGALWIIGGQELSDFVKKCKQIGTKFTFKADGGRSTKGKPGWWAK